MNGTHLVAGSSVAASALLYSRVEYVGSRHHGHEPRNDSFVVTASDGVQRSSPALVVPLAILPSNDEPPGLVLRPGLALNEGDQLLLDASTFNATDDDVPPDALEFLVLSAPRFGTITTTPDDPLKGLLLLLLLCFCCRHSECVKYRTVQYSSSSRVRVRV